MYAKVFCQILDSSIADDYKLRHFFMDLLVLADPNGVVDMTPTAISARTRIPLDEVTEFIRRLSEPDPQSRTPAFEGRRIHLIDDHRTWGWFIVNYPTFREIAMEEQRRLKTKERVQKLRLNRKDLQKCNAPVTPCNALLQNVTPTYAYASPSSSEFSLEGSVRETKAPPRKKFAIPTLEEMQFHGVKIGLPDMECQKCWNYYQSNGWKVGKNPMKNWHCTMVNWKIKWETNRTKSQPLQNAI
jgi:hypothetical protein